jgi:hypothetical protein
MNKSDLSPIVLFAYNRPWHTEQVLQALKRNDLANQSELIIYVDGPKINATEDQIKLINQVHEVVQKELWCKTVELHFADRNIGCRDSIIQGISNVLGRNDTAIVLEDDIVTSQYFLLFMNKCLEFYRNKKAVFSISGMNLPQNRMLLPNDYEYDVFASLRQLNSGWATWSDRWNLIDWNLDFIPDFLQNKELLESYSRGGDDLIPMLLDQVAGRSDAWDIQFTYNHFINHSVSIIPRYSYVDNIGGDGSGIHHLDSNEIWRFNLNQALESPRLLSVIYEDKRIVNAFYNAFCSRKRPIWQKGLNRLSRLFGGKNIFTIKKKIYD